MDMMTASVAEPTQREVGIRPGFLVVVRVVDRVLELFVRENAKGTFILDTLVLW